MPFYVVSKIAEALNGVDRSLRDSNVLVLGAAFKKDVDDARNSPAIRVMELLLKDGTRLEYNDPYVRQVTLGMGIFSRRSHDVQLQSVKLTDDVLRQADCVVITVAHGAYDFEWIVEQAKLVVDTVNATKHVRDSRDKIVLI